MEVNETSPRPTHHICSVCFKWLCYSEELCGCLIKERKAEVHLTQAEYWKDYCAIC